MIYNKATRCLIVAISLFVVGCASNKIATPQSPISKISTPAPGPTEVDVSTVKAGDLALIREAANRGNSKALIKLAMAYGYGIGVKTDSEKYLLYMSKAARAGDAQAEDLIGQLALSGDPASAVQWFMRSSAQNYAPAMYDLGLAYLVGRGTTKNEAKGCEFFLRSAAQGYDAAEYSAGTCYYDGVGFSTDLNEALKWYQKAAEQDFPLAEQVLSIIYEKGDAVNPDLTESLKWALLANGGPDNEIDKKQLAKIIGDLEQQATPQQIAAAQQGAQDFRRTHRRHERAVQIDYNGKLTF
jgi:TPR repeat protein